jgi:excinuclease UvrABC ATPase subunit
MPPTSKSAENPSPTWCSCRSKNASAFLPCSLELSETDQKVANRLLKEILNRLEYIEKVGLGYLTLNRLTSTLSGGEYQRIKLATSLGSALVGSMYILDEPSIGLHPRDTDRLIEVLKSLRDLGNTVIVVEHEEKIMKAADQIIDIGPEAGVKGGHLVYPGRSEGHARGGQYLSQPNTFGVKRKSKTSAPTANGGNTSK